MLLTWYRASIAGNANYSSITKLTSEASGQVCEAIPLALAPLQNGDYFIMHPLEHFATAPNGTPDAAILKEMVSRYGDYLERLDSEQKLALRAVLSYYLFYKLKYASHYSVSDAIIDAMPECTTASISKIILTQGISTENAEALLKFLTDQRHEGAAVLGEAVSTSHALPKHSPKPPAVFDRLTALQKQLQLVSRNHQTELDTLLFQMTTDFEAVNRELTSIKAVMSRLYSNSSSALLEATPGGQQ